jgi:1-deoxy-D-xylulose-5-phosphate reductoisomerase
LQSGGGAPTILNAANEVAVQGFLDRHIGFLDINTIVERTVEELFRGQGGPHFSSFEDVTELDARARTEAEFRINDCAGVTGGL